MVRIILLLPLALSLTFCGKKKSKAPQDTDSVVYNLPIKLTPDTKLQGKVLELAQNIQARKAVSFNGITDLMIAKHAEAGGASAADLKGQVLKIYVPGTYAHGGMLKIKYEQNLKTLHGRDLLYNREAANIKNITGEGRVQCYSGTYLYQVLRRQPGRDAFRAGREVVIFESGHVLPGYFQNNADGSKSLIGIETTTSGASRRFLAKITPQSKSVGDRRVVDAEIYAVVDLLQESLANPDEVALAALKLTAEKYGFDMPATSVAQSGATAQDTVTARLLNSSIFGFGRADVPAGDQPRADSGDDGSQPVSEPSMMAMPSPMFNPAGMILLAAEIVDGYYVEVKVWKSDFESGSPEQTMMTPPQCRILFDQSIQNFKGGKKGEKNSEFCTGFAFKLRGHPRLPNMIEGHLSAKGNGAHIVRMMLSMDLEPLQVFNGFSQPEMPKNKFPEGLGPLSPLSED